MKFQRNGFTLIEILVASTLFVSLMGVSAVAFQRISQGSEKALQVLELHAKADTLLRYLEADLRNMPQISAFQIQTSVEPYTLTFMKPVADTEPRYFHNGSTENESSPFNSDTKRITDLIWIRWTWENGVLRRGQSRKNQTSSIDSTKSVLKTLDVLAATPCGMQNNGVSPTTQQHFDYFAGKGTSIQIVAADGKSSAKPAEKLAVYQTINSSDFLSPYPGDCKLFDIDTAAWRSGDYSQLYTTLELGNNNQISDAFAVRNQDGKSVNKDWLNLVGNDATDAGGNEIYPKQIRYMFSGTEYLEFKLMLRDGKSLGAAQETDRLADNGISFDVSGVDPVTGFGYEKRPTHFRISYLLHGMDEKVRDDLDFDENGVYDEALATAIRKVVGGEPWSTRIERIHSFQAHALRHGYASVLISQSVQLGY